MSTKMSPIAVRLVSLAIGLAITAAVASSLLGVAAQVV